ncbi:helix-turn-helix transcriptional regulator [Polaribacter aestuariivivens]|uniref:helix-turn-helix transcriptional regulator n=1 Tax=Polaribacter aestuariivivens TaxID=2304626 RepID=UPI003F4964FE
MAQIKKHYILFFLSIYFTNFFVNAQEVVIRNGSDWYYYDQGYLNENWMLSNDLSNWKTGTSPIGYGDSKIKTEINFGGNEEKKHITKYFKKKINIDIKKYVAYEFKVQKDDGIVLYIDGKEIFRDNMPNVAITGKTLATDVIDGKDEDKYFSYIFDNTIFTKNEAIISVSVHQAYESSSDCIFDLELIGHDNPEILTVLVDKKNKLNSELLTKIEDLNEKIEFDKLIMQKELLENNNTNLKTSLFLTSILFILSLIGYYFLIQSKNNNKRENEKKLTAISNQILEKEKEMITLTTNILHNKQYFKEIKADIKGIETKDKSTINNILKQIDYVLERDEDWEILKEHFKAVYSGFYEKLIALHPSLSETELRHCMFVKLHMQTKEIARILLIDPRSVQTARYRIKKKIKLNEDMDLRDYLLSIS